MIVCCGNKPWAASAALLNRMPCVSAFPAMMNRGAAFVAGGTWDAGCGMRDAGCGMQTAHAARCDIFFEQWLKMGHHQPNAELRAVLLLYDVGFNTLTVQILLRQSCPKQRHAPLPLPSHPQTAFVCLREVGATSSAALSQSECWR